MKQWILSRRDQTEVASELLIRPSRERQAVGETG
jgi:hypothetical protein